MKTPVYWDTPSNKMPHFWGNFVFFFVRPILCLFRFNVVNRDKLLSFKDKSGVVVISNHTSYLDVVCQYIAIRLKQFPRYIARDTLYRRKILGFLISRCGAIPIKRDSADKTALKRSAKLLKSKDIIGIMPEGTRRDKSGKKPSLHSGAAFIARMGGNVPIIPATTINAEKVKEKGKFIKFPKITVIFGDPVLLEDFDFLPKEDRINACTWYAMRQSFAMFYSCSPQDVDMVDLFPDAKDFTEVFKNHPIKPHDASKVAGSISSR